MSGSPDLVSYIFINYPNLRTAAENTERWAKVCQVKDAYAARPKTFRQKLAARQRPPGPDCETVSRELESFERAVGERILREHLNELVFNRCPRCGALARTLAAKQCPHCFHSWHGETAAARVFEHTGRHT